MNTSQYLIPLLLILGFLQACSSETNTSSDQDDIAIAVSTADMYWGTRDVGVETTQKLYVSNRGDKPVHITRVGLSGENASEFVAEPASFTLSAGEMRAIDVSFMPRYEGRKFANLDIDVEAL